MKIAVATDDFQEITGHVGRCNGFLIVEVEKGKVINKEERANNFTHHKLHSHGAGDSHGHSHRSLVEALSDCNYLICQSAGWRLVEDLKTANIETIYTRVSDAVTAAVQLEKGELEVGEKGACHSH